MKSTLKISTLILAFAGFALGAKAQTSSTTSSKSTSSNGVILSVGVDAGLPTGNLSKGYNYNIGGSVEADFPVASQLFITGNAGIDRIHGKSNAFGPGLTDPSIHLLPVKAGLKYFPANNFYVQGEAGAGFALNKATVGFTNSAAFIYAPQAGFQFPLYGKSYLDAGLRYEGSSKFSTSPNNGNVNFFALRIAYAFDTK